MHILLHLFLLNVAQEEAGTITGTVRLGHRAPERKEIRTHRDPRIARLHPQKLLSQELVVDADNNVQDVLVCITGPLPEREYPSPRAPALIEFKGWQTHPRVIGVRPGQELVARNLDNDVHNCHTLTVVNKEMNQALVQQGNEFKRTFTMPERNIKGRCDIHPWELTWIHVFPHPFFSVTGPDGRFEIRSVPAGRYSLEIWQEACKPESIEVEVVAGQTKNIDIELESNTPPPPYAWKPLAIGAGVAVVLALASAVLLIRRR